MKKYVDRHREETEEYWVGDLVLSTKDLKYQMTERRTEKLTERFVRPYKIKSIVSTNAIELELLSTVKIHPVVNVSRVCQYTGQVEGQKKEKPQPLIIEGEEEWKVEKIMNKRWVWGRDKYLVWWKGYTAEEDTWEMSQLYYGPVVTYCMVYYSTKRVMLARLLVNEGPAIYAVHWTSILLYFHGTI